MIHNERYTFELRDLFFTEMILNCCIVSSSTKWHSTDNNISKYCILSIDMCGAGRLVAYTEYQSFVCQGNFSVVVFIFHVMCFLLSNKCQITSFRINLNHWSFSLSLPHSLSLSICCFSFLQTSGIDVVKNRTFSFIANRRFYSLYLAFFFTLYANCRSCSGRRFLSSAFAGTVIVQHSFILTTLHFD